MFEEFRVSPKCHEEISKKIQRTLLAPYSPSANPTLIALGGQPGSGKTSFAEKFLPSHPSMFFLNGDELRSFHPRHVAIRRRYPLDIASATDFNVRRWTFELFDEARKRRLDILFEGTMRTPAICDTIDVFAADGYRIDIVVAAVHPLESRYSIFTRFLSQLELNKSARYTIRESHDAAFAGMNATIGQILARGKTRLLQIIDWDGNSVNIPLSDKSQAERISLGNVLDALEQGREEFFTSGRFHDRLSRVNYPPLNSFGV